MSSLRCGCPETVFRNVVQHALEHKGQQCGKKVPFPLPNTVIAIGANFPFDYDERAPVKFRSNLSKISLGGFRSMTKYSSSPTRTSAIRQKMAITIQIPKSVDAVEYLASFSAAFSDHPEMRSALLGVEDSLRQASKLIGEPLGMLACLTAEEEAAAFLYYGLKAKGYPVPQYGKIHRHVDKLKLVVFAQAMHQYFFSKMPTDLGSAIRIERDGQKPKTSHVFNYNGYSITQDDVLETVVTSGEGEGSHDVAIIAAVDQVLTDITPSGFTPASHIKKVANRRNLCLYGDPEEKLRLRHADEIIHFRANCVAMITLGLLVFNGQNPTPSMVKLVECIFDKIRQ